MALMIRLRKQGRTNRQTFRLVVTDGREPRDGKYLEKVGWYLPCEKENRLHVDEERINYWLSKGAQLSENAERLIGKAAPAVIIALHEKQHAKRQKECAKRRALRKKKGKAVQATAKASAKAPVKAKKEEKKAEEKSDEAPAES